MTRPQLFHCLRYTDADRGINFLQAIGFTTAMVVRDPDDSTVVTHAQLAWRDNGGIMLGSTQDGDPHYGPGICNLVVASDEDVDSLFATALEHGASTVTEPNCGFVRLVAGFLQRSVAVLLPRSRRTGCR